MNDVTEGFISDVDRLRLIENGLTNYSKGIYCQIYNCNAILNKIHESQLNNEKIYNLIGEIQIFLERIAEIGNIDDVYGFKCQK